MSVAEATIPLLYLILAMPIPGERAGMEHWGFLILKLISIGHKKSCSRTMPIVMKKLLKLSRSLVGRSIPLSWMKRGKFSQVEAMNLVNLVLLLEVFNNLLHLWKTSISQSPK